MTDATGVAEAMLGLPGFRVLEVHEDPGEVIVVVELRSGAVGCPGCGVVARSHGRTEVDYRDLACFGRPAQLRWRKRRFRCEEPACATATWSEDSPEISARCLLTDRAGLECCLQVGLNARAVAQMARELGVCWDTVMAAVAEHGQPLIDDPERVGEVRQRGIDETTWLSATKDHATLFATSMVDLGRRVVIDVVPGNSAADLGSWLDRQPEGWRAGIRVVATDLAESYRAGLEGRLDGAIRVADPFHVTRLANRCLDQVRRRVQNQTLGHRGGKRDPLYRIRKLMLTGTERLEGPGLERMLLGLRIGDPDQEVLGAWLAKESVRDVYLAARADEAELLTDKAITGCAEDSVAEVRALGRTLARWRTEILNRHRTGASNGPTEGLNRLIKKVKRAGHGFRSFANYRLRILLHAGASAGPRHDRCRRSSEAARHAETGRAVFSRRHHRTVHAVLPHTAHRRPSPDGIQRSPPPSVGPRGDDASIEGDQAEQVGRVLAHHPPSEAPPSLVTLCHEEHEPPEGVVPDRVEGAG